MKHKSELINEILEQQGHEVPTLHYQSECVESWVAEAKGAYPKLCDYESEWLNYINENPIGEFPYETVTTNSTATVNHVVPFAYKSAILTGDSESPFDRFEIGTYSSYDGTKLPKENNTTRLRTKNTYSGIVGEFDFSVDDGYKLLLQIGYISDNDLNTSGWVQSVRYTATTDKLFGVVIKKDDGSTLTLDDIKNSGFQTNYPILGELISVKMPVLSTIGKNLNNSDIEIGSILDSTGLPTSSVDVKRTKDFIKIKPNTSLVFSSDGVIARIFYYDINMNFIKWEYSNTSSIKITTPINCYYVKVRFASTNSTYLQIEQNTQSTEYEPYKSNILTINEEVTLRGIGDIQDELDLLTGEVTERIGEVVLDGSESWQYTSNGDNTMRFNLPISDFKDYGVNSHGKGLIGDKLPKVTFSADGGRYGVSSWRNHIVFFTEHTTLNDFKQWLSQNPSTLQYELSTHIIKTVDLTVVNQDGEPLSKIKPIEGTMHVEVSGTPIAPTAVLEVPVEAITQNLNSFIEEE